MGGAAGPLGLEGLLKAAQSVERGIGPVCRTYFPEAERTDGSGRTRADVEVEGMADARRRAERDEETRRVAIDAQTGEAHECLDGPQGCSGKVEFRMPLSSTGRSFARCEKHWGERLERQQEITQRYPQLPPADFDPAYAGEAW